MSPASGSDRPAFRLIMEGGPHHGRVIAWAESHPPLFYQFAAMPDLPVCSLAADEAPPYKPLEADSYQRAAPAQGDRTTWFYDYAGRH